MSQNLNKLPEHNHEWNPELKSEIEGLRLINACAAFALYRIAEEPKMTWEEVRRIAKAANEECKGIQEEYILNTRPESRESKALEAADRWIPVSERLPDENGPYLFTFAFHKGKKQFGGRRVVEELYYADRQWFSNFDDYESDPENGESFESSQYIAWQPLPAPYSGGTRCR